MIESNKVSGRGLILKWHRISGHFGWNYKKGHFRISISSQKLFYPSNLQHLIVTPKFSVFWDNIMVNVPIKGFIHIS